MESPPALPVRPSGEARGRQPPGKISVFYHGSCKCLWGLLELELYKVLLSIVYIHFWLLMLLLTMVPTKSVLCEKHMFYKTAHISGPRRSPDMVLTALHVKIHA